MQFRFLSVSGEVQGPGSESDPVWGFDEAHPGASVLFWCRGDTGNSGSLPGSGVHIALWEGENQSGAPGVRRRLQRFRDQIDL